MKDNSKFWHYYRAQTAHCDFCNILFFRTLVIAFTVLTTILGAVVVGLALVVHGGNEYTPDVLEDFAVSINNITTAMIILGGIIICMSIMGCLATVFENTWFTVAFVMTLVLCMAGQLSCGILTLFLREEVREWATDRNYNCTTCFDAFETAFEYPTVLAVLLLAALGVQLAIIASACKASRMRTEAKRALLLAEFIPSNEVCEREARRYCNPRHDLDCKKKSKDGLEKDKKADTRPVTGGEPWSAKSSRPRPSTSPAKVHQQQPAIRESLSGYERIGSIDEENAIEVH